MIANGLIIARSMVKATLLVGALLVGCVCAIAVLVGIAMLLTMIGVPSPLAPFATLVLVLWLGAFAVILGDRWEDR